MSDFSVNSNDELILNDCFDNVSEINASSQSISDMQTIFDEFCNLNKNLIYTQLISNMIFNKNVVDVNSDYYL